MVHVQQAVNILTIFCSITQVLKLFHQCQLHAHIPRVDVRYTEHL
jgi:hypothetical protein